MVAKQRIRMANEKHSKNITQRGNVAKTLVRRRRRRAGERASGQGGERGGAGRAAGAGRASGSSAPRPPLLRAPPPTGRGELAEGAAGLAGALVRGEGPAGRGPSGRGSWGCHGDKEEPPQERMGPVSLGETESSSYRTVRATAYTGS